MRKLFKNLFFPKKDEFRYPDTEPKGIRHTLVDAEYWKLFPQNDILKLSKNIQTIK